MMPATQTDTTYTFSLVDTWVKESTYGTPETLCELIAFLAFIDPINHEIHNGNNGFGDPECRTPNHRLPDPPPSLGRESHYEKNVRDHIQCQSDCR